jgi:hypothetical protein
MRPELPRPAPGRASPHRRPLPRPRDLPPAGRAGPEQPQPSRSYQLLTVAGILTLAALTLFIAAFAVSSTIVDVSPFSTNGALVLANAPESVDRDRFFRQLVAYGALVTVLAPIVLWLGFVVVLG